MSDGEEVTEAAMLITQGDYMAAMRIFETVMEASPDDAAGYHGWAEAAMFEIQEHGNLDDAGKDRINEGQIQSYLRRATTLDPENADYVAAYANALIEFDRVPMAIRQYQKLQEIGAASDEVDVSFHLYEAARLLIDAIDLKTDFNRSHDFARKYVRTAVEFALLGLGFSSVGEAVEYLDAGE